MNASPTRRVDHGRGHSYWLDGSKTSGVTKDVGDGYPKPALIGWAARNVAGYAVDHWDELAEMSPSERLRALEKAQWGTRDTAAVRGQDVHALAERLAAGEELDVPEHLEGYVDAYLAFVREWKPAELLVEATIINRTAGYMGTLDLVADLADGLRWLIDMKTSASGIYPDIALQLAAYRYAETYLTSEGEEDMPKVDRCAGLWLRDDGSYELIPVRAGWDEFRLFQYVQRVAAFGREPRETVLSDPLKPPAEAPASSGQTNDIPF